LGSLRPQKRLMWSTHGQRVGTPAIAAQTHMVQRRPGRTEPWCREGQQRQPWGPSWCWSDDGVWSWVSGELRWDWVLSVARVLLAFEAIAPSLYKQPWQMGKWNLGVRGENFMHSDVVMLSVAQLRVPGNHRGSGYPRIASLSCSSRLSTRDLLWLLVGKWFPLWAGEDRNMSSQGYS
jgi:hypothetical protein